MQDQESVTEIPAHLKEKLGHFKAVGYDSRSGEPVSWGYPIVGYLGKDLWEEISKYGTKTFMPNGTFNSNGRGGSWVLVTKTLKKY